MAEAEASLIAPPALYTLEPVQPVSAVYVSSEEETSEEDGEPIEPVVKLVNGSFKSVEADAVPTVKVPLVASTVVSAVLIIRTFACVVAAAGTVHAYVPAEAEALAMISDQLVPLFEE
jgi:hypothetical protein